MLSILNKIICVFGLQLYKSKSLISKPIDENKVQILYDLNFQNSCKEVRPNTLLDTNRLVNLWEYCQRSNPEGVILEVGSYKGGGALHLSNCQPQRKVFIFESFEGFETVDEKLDINFNMKQFKDTAQAKVESLFNAKGRTAIVTPGFFPDSAKNIEIPAISFVHLDVDIYKATIESLLYLDDKMMDKSFIVLDDCRRGCEGVDKAVDEFIKQSNNWIYLPLFPSQGLLVHKSWMNEQV
jgi:hypothetical protein